MANADDATSGKAFVDSLRQSAGMRSKTGAKRNVKRTTAATSLSALPSGPMGSTDRPPKQTKGRATNERVSTLNGLNPYCATRSRYSYAAAKAKAPRPRENNQSGPFKTTNSTTAINTTAV